MSKEMNAGGLHAVTIEDFFPTREIWADEDEIALSKLKTALMADLDPRTPYQHVFAENLVELEWEKLRHRRMRNALLNAELKEKTTTALSGQTGFLAQVKKEDQETARDLISSDPLRQKSAKKTLAKKDIPVSELYAAAYQKCLRDLAYFEAQISEVETRRRKLLIEYALLKSEQAILVEDANVLDSA